MTFKERRQLLRLLIEKVTVEEGRVRIETIMATDNLPGKLSNGVPNDGYTILPLRFTLERELVRV